MGGIDQVIPVNAYIPGCPPRPAAIIDGLVKLLGSLSIGENQDQIKDVAVQTGGKV
jgi:Ni,Fe-hydrogenase III small subunit